MDAKEAMVCRRLNSICLTPLGWLGTGMSVLNPKMSTTVLCIVLSIDKSSESVFLLQWPDADLYENAHAQLDEVGSILGFRLLALSNDFKPISRGNSWLIGGIHSICATKERVSIKNLSAFPRRQQPLKTYYGILSQSTVSARAGAWFSSQCGVLAHFAGVQGATSARYIQLTGED